MIINHYVGFEETTDCKFVVAEVIANTDVSPMIFQQLMQLKANFVYDIPRFPVVVVVTNRAISIIEIVNGTCSEQVEIYETVSVDDKIEYCFKDNFTIYVRVGNSRPVGITIVPEFC